MHSQNPWKRVVNQKAINFVNIIAQAQSSIQINPKQLSSGQGDFSRAGQDK